VEILGSEYVLRSQLDEAQLRRVAAYLDNKLNEILSTTNTSSTISLVILAALNITNELLRARDEQDRLLKEIEAKTERLLKTLEQACAGISPPQPASSNQLPLPHREGV